MGIVLPSPVAARRYELEIFERSKHSNIARLQLVRGMGREAT